MIKKERDVFLKALQEIRKDDKFDQFSSDFFDFEDVQLNIEITLKDIFELKEILIEF